MATFLTPGVRFLAVTIPKAMAPPVFVHATLRYLGPNFFGSNFHLTRALILCIWLFTLPLYFYLRGQYTHWKYQREARRMGAELPPFVQGMRSLPSFLSILMFQQENSHGILISYTTTSSAKTCTSVTALPEGSTHMASPLPTTSLGNSES